MGRAKLNIIGNTYGKLVVISEEPKPNKRDRLYLCKCVCGNTKKVKQCNLVTKDTQSCGCLAKIRTHGDTGKRLYNIYHEIFKIISK